MWFVSLNVKRLAVIDNVSTTVDICIRTVSFTRVHAENTQTKFKDSFQIPRFFWGENVTIKNTIISSSYSLIIVFCYWYEMLW